MGGSVLETRCPEVPKERHIRIRLLGTVPGALLTDVTSDSSLSCLSFS